MKQCLETHCEFRGIFILQQMPKQLTTLDFIKRAREIHGNKYDYSQTIYNNSSSKITIICQLHGEFNILARSHIGKKKCGCRKCSYLKTENLNNFLKIAREVHDNKYDYCNVEYVNSKTKICIICPEHGLFWQRPQNHLKEQGCLKCGNIKAVIKRRKGSSYFSEKSNIIHNYKYDYKLVEYTSLNDKFKIICPEHGVFEQLGSGHIRGKGCPNCSNYVSNPEIEVSEFVKSLNLQILTSKRNIIKPYELDIYIPSLNKAIEFNGTYWHYSKKHFIPGKHGNKSNLCREKGIKLLHIREDLWNRDKEKMKQIILKFLNI